MSQYFALKPRDQIGTELIKLVDEYGTFVSQNGILSRWKRAYQSYYGLDKTQSFDSTQIGKAGEDGELSVMRVNHSRNLLQHLLTMVTSQRPALTPVAINTDFESQAQTTMASGLLDYYLKQKNLERFLKDAVEIGLLFAEGFVESLWDATSGEVYGVNPDTGAPIFEGDVSFSALSPLDVIRAINKRSPNADSWVIVRKWKNRYDLAAKFPEHAEKLVKLESNDYLKQEITFRVKDHAQRDDVPVYTFYHKRSEALPQGRIIEFCTDDIILIDQPLPYREVPVYRISPSDQLFTQFGYSSFYDLLGPQQAVDALYSTVLSNQSNFGVQNVAIPKGSDLSTFQLSGGMNVFEFDPKSGPPQPLNLTETPAEIFNFIRMLEGVQETLSGINSTVRGNPEASLKSGAALALVSSQAIQFSSGLQQSYNQLVEKVGSSLLVLLRDFATVPRVASIIGKHNRPFLKQFTGKDLEKVNRVTVESANPLSRTSAGRLEIAKDLLGSGLIKRPEQYISVLQTGQLEPLYESEVSELLTIRAENEMMQNGETPIAVITDSHAQHIKEHKSVLASPEARKNPALVRAALAHIQEHIDLLRSADPVLLQMLGEQPVAPVNPGPAPANMANPTQPVMQQASQVKPAQMPSLPQDAPPEVQSAYEQQLSKQPA